MTATPYPLVPPVSGTDVLPPAARLESWFVEGNPEYATQIKDIINHWSMGARVDEVGNVWLKISSLPHVIRVLSMSEMAAFRLGKYENRTFQDERYLRATRVGKTLELVMRSRDEACSRFAEISREIGLLIRNSPVARSLQDQHYESLAATREQLKKLRYRKKRIMKDELSGEAITSANAQFIYLRSPSFYPEYANEFQNGLIVGKTVYQKVRAGRPADEREMFYLCDRMGWEKGWYRDIPFSKTIEVEA